MRPYAIIYLLVSTCLTSTAFFIDPPFPSTVIVGQAVTFTWIRNSSTDPSEFSFLEIPLSSPELAPIFPVPVDKALQESGSITLTFFQPSPFLVVAVDNNAMNTFFTAVGTIVAERLQTIVVSGATTSTSTTSTADANWNTSLRLPTPVYAPIVPPTNPPTATVTALPHTSNTGAIAGGVVGGVLALFLVATVVFCILQRRNKKLKHDFDPTPYLDWPVSSSDAPYMEIGARKAQMIGQRERLQRELEAYEQSAQESNSRSGAFPNGVNGSNQEEDVVQALRRQMEVLTKIMATLEAGMAPPDFSSRTSRLP
ncbi:hypothetical protein E1B28_013040 [Marasmius oreades]|uniref:receptor protein-tyrosine kinase n=1 Tax=Marasmius oreades TaxID=181124 RepID=A0A9P7RNS0_9AGAR|nr:uncharacterized protein E1B28_013040 [Marasmius oreades]KAG7087059.1 hypothetical protein E1B28_013040 [Marasmius oreades]